jgi:hypothetical protein
MNTYSEQRTDVSVFKVCDLCGDHATGDLDIIASGIRGGCDGINSGNCVCGIQDVDLDGKKKNLSGVCVCNGGRIGGARFVCCVANGGRGGFNGILSGICCGCNGVVSGDRCVCDCIVGVGRGGCDGVAGRPLFVVFATST